LLAKAPPRTIAASAVPHRKGEPRGERGVENPPEPPKAQPETQRRTARIVTLTGGAADERERERQKLLQRLMQSQGRGAITRAADEYLRNGFELPDEQEVHLQLLEHFDEARARDSLEAMARLLKTDPPLKRPVLDGRLRRLEEHADEAPTRKLAADLRRAIRT
jgi:hypothetical protein